MVVNLPYMVTFFLVVHLSSIGANTMVRIGGRVGAGVLATRVKHTRVVVLASVSVITQEAHARDFLRPLGGRRLAVAAHTPERMAS